MDECVDDRVRDHADVPNLLTAGEADHVHDLNGAMTRRNADAEVPSRTFCSAYSCANLGWEPKNAASDRTGAADLANPKAPNPYRIAN